MSRAVGDPGVTEPVPEPPAPLWLKAAGTAVACLGGLLLGLAGAFLTPFRVGSVLVPVSLPLAVGGLAALVWFTYTVTEHVGLSLLPGGVWLVVSLVLSVRTDEGDLVLINQNWVASAYLLLGSVTVAAVAYALILRRRR
jgi:hypothetical protein